MPLRRSEEIGVPSGEPSTGLVNGVMLMVQDADDSPRRVEGVPKD